MIANFIQNFADLEVVQHAFAGIRIAVCVLILAAVTKMGKNCIKSWPCPLVFLVTQIVMVLVSPPPVFVIVGAVVSVGIIIFAPLIAKRIGLNTPKAAVAFGGLMGTKSGTIAGLAATDESLVPFGVLSTAFYTGLGCLLCPSLFHWCVQLFLG